MIVAKPARDQLDRKKKHVPCSRTRLKIWKYTGTGPVVLIVVLKSNNITVVRSSTVRSKEVELTMHFEENHPQS